MTYPSFSLAVRTLARAKGRYNKDYTKVKTDISNSVFHKNRLNNSHKSNSQATDKYNKSQGIYQPFPLKMLNYLSSIPIIGLDKVYKY